MSEMQKLRSSVEQILTAAADEIFQVFKRSIAEIEEKLGDSPKHKKRRKRRPGPVPQTDVLIPPEQQGRSPHGDQGDPEPPHIKQDQEEQWISQEGEQSMTLTLLSECPTLKLWTVHGDQAEASPEQPDRSPSPEQLDPQSPHTMEEENLWTNQEGGRLQGREEARIAKLPSAPARVKSEYEDEAQCSQLHQSQTEENTEEPEDEDEDEEDYEGSEPDCFQNDEFPISDATCQTTQHQFPDDDKTLTFRCSVCNKGFANQSEVTQHMSFHTSSSGVKDGHLKEYMVLPTGEKPFCCPCCQKGFDCHSHLIKHMLVHTGQRPFTCSVCMKGFGQKASLNRHMLVHTGQRPFTCSVCMKSFGQKASLNRHMLVHTGQRPFSCSVCDKGFTRNFDVKQHMLTHSRKKPSTH